MKYAAPDMTKMRTNLDQQTLGAYKTGTGIMILRYTLAYLMHQNTPGRVDPRNSKFVLFCDETTPFVCACSVGAMRVLVFLENFL